jgi:hypothetical protein
VQWQWYNIITAVGITNSKKIRLQDPVVFGADKEQYKKRPSTVEMDTSTPTQSPTHQAMESSNGLNLGGVYRQCSNARSVSNCINVTTVGGGTINTETSCTPKIGSLDWAGDEKVLRTFHGGRITKNGRTSNECVSISYDPRNLMCLGCESPHSILSNSTPVTLIFSDQNFVPFLSGGPDNCIGVCRGENFSLNELVDLAAEILDKKHLQPGSVLLFGSASHLYKVGGPAYISDWISLVNRCSQRWPSINICPLIPICRTECPGNIIREIEVLASWLGRIYSCSTVGLLDSWRKLLQAYQANLDRSVPTMPPAVFKTLLPSSLSLSSLQPHTFVFSEPCPNSFGGLDSASVASIIASLIDTLSRDFSVHYNASNIIARSMGITVDMGSNDIGKLDWDRHIVIIGASNMRRLVPVLNAAGFTVTDLSKSSWLATEENIASLISSMSTLLLPPRFSVILELFSNSSFRFKQFDGSLSLPFKDGTGYHMGGEITVCDDENFLTLLAALEPVLMAAQNHAKVIVPPLPRYLFNKCCKKAQHSTNVGGEGHSLTLLNATTHLHHLLKDGVSKMGVKNYHVLNGVGGLLGISPSEPTPSNPELLTDLKPLFASDGVHYSDMAYRHLAKTMVEATMGIVNGSLNDAGRTASTPELTPTPRPSFFWRGFSSPVGYRQLPNTGTPNTPNTGSLPDRSHARHFTPRQASHPYKKWSKN